MKTLVISLDDDGRIQRLSGFYSEDLTPAQRQTALAIDNLLEMVSLMNDPESLPPVSRADAEQLYQQLQALAKPEEEPLGQCQEYSRDVGMCQQQATWRCDDCGMQLCARHEPKHEHR